VEVRRRDERLRFTVRPAELPRPER
jgi:hypothetical protein